MPPHHHQQQPMHGILNPHDNDVLSGRGNFVNYHVGNENFRALVRKHKVAYVACPKPQKGKWSKMIVDEVRALHPPGRFLKQDEVTKLWYDIGDKKAMDKTRQALREGAPDIMKEISGEDGEDDTDSPLSRRPPSVIGSMQSPGMGAYSQASPHRQAPARSVSCQPQLLNGMRGDNNMANYSPAAYLSPQTIGLHNSIHNDSRLQPMPSLSQAPNSLGSRSHHAHQVPQRTPSLHLSTAGNLATMQLMAQQQQQQQQQNLSQSLHSPAQAQQSISLSQHLTQQSPQQLQQQHILQRQQQLLMDQRRQQPVQSLPQHLTMSPQSMNVGQQQQQLLQQHLSLSQHASDHQRMQQQQQQQQQQEQLQQLQQQFQQMPQHQNFHEQPQASHTNSMQIMPPLYQAADMQNSSPGPIFSGGSSHGQYQNAQALSRNSSYHNNFPRPLAPAPGIPKAPPLSLPGQPDDNSFGESERLAPLPKRSELKLPREKLKREGSEGSLQVDNIFPTSVKTKQTDGTNTADYNKNHQSSSHMSVMSLSVGDMGLGDDAVGDMPSTLTSQLAAIRDEKDLSTRFNNSLRLGRGRQSSKTGAAKRSSAFHGSELADASQNNYMDMSVATLGDRLSEFGDMSVARMTESQANMSFMNVFEETDKDICTERKS